MPPAALFDDVLRVVFLPFPRSWKLQHVGQRTPGSANSRRADLGGTANADEYLRFGAASGETADRSRGWRAARSCASKCRSPNPLRCIPGVHGRAPHRIAMCCRCCRRRSRGQGPSSDRGRPRDGGHRSRRRESRGQHRHAKPRRREGSALDGTPSPDGNDLSTRAIRIDKMRRHDGAPRCAATHRPVRAFRRHRSRPSRRRCHRRLCGVALPAQPTAEVERTPTDPCAGSRSLRLTRARARPRTLPGERRSMRDGHDRAGRDTS